MPEEQRNDVPLTAAFLTQVFASFEARLETRFVALETKIDERFAALRNEMIERIEDTETRLLKEFRKWAVRIESVGV